MLSHKHKADDTYTTLPFVGCVALPGRCKQVTHGNVTYTFRCNCGATKLVNQNAFTKEHGLWTEKEND